MYYIQSTRSGLLLAGGRPGEGNGVDNEAAFVWKPVSQARECLGFKTLDEAVNYTVRRRVSHAVRVVGISPLRRDAPGDSAVPEVDVRPSRARWLVAKNFLDQITKSKVLTHQQKATLRGQAVHGDLEGAIRGYAKLCGRKKEEGE